MSFYIAVILSSSFLAWIANTQKNRNRIITFVLFVISAVIMFVPLAFRSVGVDYEEYIKGYASTAVNWSTYWSGYLGRPEPLYALLNYIARWIFGDFQGVNILCALLSIAFTFAGIYSYKDKVNLGLAIWCQGFLYYIIMFGLNRLMISVSIIAWTWKYYFSKNTAKFIIWAVIAGLFHYAALLMIPFYYVLRWMEGKSFSLKKVKWIRVILSITLILVVIYYYIPRLFGGFYWFARYSKYFDLSFTFSALNNNAGTYLIVFIVLIFRKPLAVYLDEYKSMLNMLIMYTVLSFACVIMPIHRLTYYFYPICILLYSAIPASGVLAGKRTNYKVTVNAVYILIVFIMGLLWIYQFLHNNLWGQYLIPYRWSLS